ncbi:MAG: ABC transporter permease [Solirubrobacteraceae bacterium]
MIATALRVLRQLRHDPRTVVLMIGVPCGLMTVLRFVYAGRRPVFDSAGAPLLAIFPLFTMFLVTSIALLRERTTGTLERLLTTPLRKLDLLGGYALAFALLAAVQAVLVSTLSLGPLGLRVKGPEAAVVALAVAVALLGLGLGLLASAFARTEFQVVQFLPATIVPQLLLCGLLVPRERMSSLLTAVSDALPMSYAVDATHHLSREAGAGGWFWADLAIVAACAVGAVALGAATLRRRTA